MGIKDEVLEVQKELKEVKEQSFAMELLKDARKTNKRQFIVIIVILSIFTCLLGYTIWLLNDIGTVETIRTQEVTDFDTINGSVINGNN